MSVNEKVNASDMTSGDNESHQVELFAVDQDGAATGASFTVAERAIRAYLSSLTGAALIDGVNGLRGVISQYSPFKSEPTDFVMWVPADSVHANEYNPNVVAPVEMELLKLSIAADGYTMPIVTMRDEDGRRTVIDGFHRNRVGKEDAQTRERIHGYLPVVQIRESRTGASDRMASTIRHNRARGKHQVQAMSDIVIELRRRNWTPEKIGKELGMEADEVLRLCQVSGIAELFADEKFSAAWDVIDGEMDLEAEFTELSEHTIGEDE